MRVRLSIIPVVIAVATISCSQADKSFDRGAIKSEIEKLLKIQEDAYGGQSPEAKRRTVETCFDSLVFIGGDSGGLATSAEFYSNDLADGYIERPHDRHFQIYENMVIVTSLHQGYKLLSNDTLLLNSRSTKIFTRDGESWKMAYVTYAPVPVIYSPIQKVDEKVLKQYEGNYKLDASTTETLSVLDGKLISTIGGDKLELLPLNDSTFIIPGFFGKTIFGKDKKGDVTHYNFEFIDGQRINFPKAK